MSWKDLSLDREGGERGVIVEKPVVKAVPRPRGVESTTIQVQELLNFGPDIAAFVIKQDRHRNRPLLDRELYPLTCGLALSLVEEGNLRGLIMAIPHHMKIDNRVIRVGLTTHLLIEEKHRRQGWAMVLIQQIIQRSHEVGIVAGYQYMPNPQSLSNVKLRAWYRVLDAKEAQRLGYYCPPDRHSMEEGHDALVSPCEFKDLAGLTDTRRLSLPLTKEDWNHLSHGPIKWLLCRDVRKRRPQLVVAYRPWTLSNPRGCVRAALCVYAESFKGSRRSHIASAFRSFLGYLSRQRVTVVHGVEAGPLTGLSRDLNLVFTDDIYLDFYNLRCRGLSSGDVSLLYT